MKKLLSFLAAGALALGLIGCSGDLHDTVDPSTIPLSIALQSAPRLSAGGVPGAMNSWDNTTTWTTTDDSTCTYVYEFKATAETIEWKAITTAGNWNSGAWGGGDNEALSVPLDTKTALIYDGATGGKKNCSTSGLKEGKMYSITLNYENGGYSATVTALDKEAPVPFYIDGYAISGSMNAWAYDVDTVLSEEKRTVNEQNGYVTYKYDFEAREWDGDLSVYKDSTSVQFGIRSATGNWATKYVGADFVYGTDKDYKETKKNGDNNNKVTGLTAGGRYRMYIQTTPAGVVSYKVVILKQKEVGLNVTNLPAALNGKVFYLRGYNGWDCSEAYKGTVVSNALSITFNHYYEEEKLSYSFEGKLSINGSWTTQLSGVSDGKGNTKNISFEFTEDSPILDFVYRGNTGTTDDGCTYYVILPNYTTVVVSGLVDAMVAESSLDLQSNISWGGVTAGKWSADGENWSNETINVKPDTTNKTITFYITGNYNITGTWVDAEKKGDTNFKLSIRKKDGNDGIEGAATDRWFKIDVLKEKNELVWTDGTL